jgi:hypothetical protein
MGLSIFIFLNFETLKLNSFLFGKMHTKEADRLSREMSKISKSGLSTKYSVPLRHREEA